MTRLSTGSGTRSSWRPTMLHFDVMRPSLRGPEQWRPAHFSTPWLEHFSWGPFVLNVNFPYEPHPREAGS